MPVKDYLERRNVQIILVVAVLVVILVVYQVGGFLVYGVPAITFQTVTQVKPVSKTVTILSSFGEWIAYEYYGEWEASYKHDWDWWGRIVKVGLKATLKVKVETSDPMLSDFLTEIKPPPFLIEETETNIYYKNMTIHAYAYVFKITLALSCSANAFIIEEREWGLIPWTIPSKEDMVKKCIREGLVPDFNKNYLVQAGILMSIDAPTLATDKAYELRPDYLGLCGMWLADYQTIGYTTGTAVEGLPATKDTAVKLFRDKDLSSPCWAPNYDAAMGKPLLTPNTVYWLQDFAAQSAWWETIIVNLGSQLVYDETKTYPNLVSWAWEKYGENPPAIVQWFRVDIAFRVTEDWTVPKIPEYEPPPPLTYTLSVLVRDAGGVPIEGATVISPFTATTGTDGVASAELEAKSYTVTVSYADETKSQSVTLDADKTVIFTYPMPLPIYTYTVTYVVQDQVGNPLPAIIKEDTETHQCDKFGRFSKTYTTEPGETFVSTTVMAQIQVGTRTFERDEIFTVSSSMDKTITITRRFFWSFFINYTDGTLATGTLTASSPVEILTVPVANGYGEAYLIDVTYTFSFEASPAVTLETVAIINDGEFYATVNKETETTEITTTTEIPTTAPTTPVTTPEIPWLLIPSIYIYALLGVLVFGFIIAAVVRLRKPSK